MIHLYFQNAPKAALPPLFRLTRPHINRVIRINHMNLTLIWPKPKQFIRISHSNAGGFAASVNYTLHLRRTNMSY